MSPKYGTIKDSCNPNEVAYSQLMNALGKKSAWIWMTC